MTIVIISAFALAALFLSGNGQRLAAIVAFMLAMHFGIDNLMVDYGYFERFGIAATFDAITIGLIAKTCEQDRATVCAVRILIMIMLTNLLTGLTDWLGFDIYETYYQLALTQYALLIVSIGVLNDGRANFVHQLGSLFGRLRPVRAEKV